MPVEILGTYMMHTAYVPYLKNNNERIFEHSLRVSEDVFEELANKFGYTLIQPEPGYWMYVPKHVAPHRDWNGKCLIYLHSGKGELGVLYKGQIHQERLRAGQVILFDDRKTHYWLSDRPCTMIVGNVQKLKRR